MPNKIKIPEYIKRWYQDLGVTSLPEFLEPRFVVPIPIVPGWMLGQLKTIELPTMAGDGATLFSPADGHRWKLMYGIFKIVCDATVANRYFRIQLMEGSDILSIIGSNQTAITASQTKRILMHQSSLDDGWFWGDVGSTIVGSTNLQNWLIHDDWNIQLTVSGGVAGDVVTGRWTVLEMEEYGDIL